jgi:hypothetical protein
MHRFLQLPGPLGQGLYGGLSLEAGRIGRSYSLLGTKGTTGHVDNMGTVAVSPAFVRSNQSGRGLPHSKTLARSLTRRSKRGRRSR